MAEIESSLGKTSSASRSGGRAGVLTVEDESDPRGSFDHNPTYRAGSVQRQAEAMGQRMSDEELKHFEERRAEALEAKRRISPEARARIEFLLELGRITDSVVVEEIKFTFQSLKGEEQNDVFAALSGFREISALKMQYEVRFHTLARALTHIQDKPFEDVIESNDINDKLAVIRGMDENLTEYLYKWYQQNIVKLAQEKYVIHTKEDLEEVLEDIKK